MIPSSLSIELSTNYARKNWDLYARWVAIILAFVLVGSALTCVGLATVGPAAVHAWTHGKVTIGAHILLLFGISVSLQAAWNVGATMLGSANKHHRQCIVFFVTTLFALTASAFTAGRFGFVGVPVIMIIADVVILISAAANAIRAFPEVPLHLARLLQNVASFVAASLQARVLSPAPRLATLGASNPVSNNPPSP